VDAVAPKPLFQVSASLCNDGDTTDAAADGLVPRNSDDQEIPQFTWWPHKGSTEWLQLEFPKSCEVSRVEVYWFDDIGHGGCRVPKSWKVLYLDGPDWKPVAGPRTEPVEKDRFNVTSFTPVKTEALRLEVQLQPEMSGGVLECRVP